MYNNKKESKLEKLWRFRGLLLVALIPVLLLTIVLVLAPRPPFLGIEKQKDFSKNLYHSPNNSIYSIVIDAGSTGSRVHILKFAKKKSKLTLLNDGFVQVQPGLSSYANDPAKGAKSLKTLIDTALTTVPKTQLASTPISVRATAGLRLLPEGQADALLEAVRSFLTTLPFKSTDDSVSILDGQEEGAFAWLTLNYLLGRLDGDAAAADRTVAAIDLGGGSVQEAFLLTPEKSAAAPKGYVKRLQAMDRAFDVYVHSYLGYGLMAARAQVLALQTTYNASVTACFAKGVEGNYSYAGKQYAFLGDEKAAGFGGCAKVNVKALDKGKSCGASVCSFAGAWRGAGGAGREYFVSSYFFDRAVDAGLLPNKTVASWVIKPQEFAKVAQKACAVDATPAALLKQFPSAANKEQLPFLCQDLAYCATLLTEGFQLPPAQEVTLVKQVLYNGKLVEAAWPLGAALNDLVGATA